MAVNQWKSVTGMLSNTPKMSSRSQSLSVLFSPLNCTHKKSGTKNSPGFSFTTKARFGSEWRLPQTYTAVWKITPLAFSVY